MELETLLDIISSVMGVDADEITENSSFIDDLGADSLDVFQIISEIEDEFDIEVRDEDYDKISTVGEAVELIKNAIN